MTEKGELNEAGQHILRRKMVKQLPVKLTTKEMLQAGRDQADAQEQHQEIERQAKQAASEYKGKLKQTAGTIIRLANLVRAGYEHREVKCEQVFDFDEGRVKIMRLDTAEIVEDRPLRADEGQMALPLTQAERIAKSVLEEEAAEAEREGEGEGDSEAEPEGGEPEGEAESEEPPASDDEPSEPQPQKTTGINPIRNSGPITDEELNQALSVMREVGRASTAVVQRRMRIGFVRACKLMEEMERQGWIGETKGTTTREMYPDKFPEPGMAKVIPQE